jgi:stage II sporulation protein D
MCQVGAMGRARAGQDYRTILQAYYPGIQIERMY